MTTVDKPTLTYFNIGALGELSRLVLEVSDTEYHYHAISFRGSRGEPFDEYKAKHGSGLTFGQVPRYQEPGLSFSFSLSLST